MSLYGSTFLSERSPASQRLMRLSADALRTAASTGRSFTSLSNRCTGQGLGFKCCHHQHVVIEVFFVVSSSTSSSP